MQYDNSNVGYVGPQVGAVAAGPILNGTPPPIVHPLDNVAQLIHDHTNVLRQRLFAAQAQQGLAPEQVSEHGQVMANPLDIVRQTKATGSQNLAALLAKFHGLPGLRPGRNIDPGFYRPDMSTYDIGGGFRQPGGFEPR